MNSPGPEIINSGQAFRTSIYSWQPVQLSSFPALRKNKITTWLNPHKLKAISFFNSTQLDSHHLYYRLAFADTTKICSWEFDLPDVDSRYFPCHDQKTILIPSFFHPVTGFSYTGYQEHPQQWWMEAGTHLIYCGIYCANFLESSWRFHNMTYEFRPTLHRETADLADLKPTAIQSGLTWWTNVQFELDTWFTYDLLLQYQAWHSLRKSSSMEEQPYCCIGTCNGWQTMTTCIFANLHGWACPGSITNQDSLP